MQTTITNLPPLTAEQIKAMDQAQAQINREILNRPTKYLVIYHAAGIMRECLFTDKEEANTFASRVNGAICECLDFKSYKSSSKS